MSKFKTDTASPRLQKFKEGLAADLVAAAEKIDGNQVLPICVEMKISTASYYRYTSGNVDELRNLELAETLLTAIKKAPKPQHA